MSRIDVSRLNAGAINKSIDGLPYGAAEKRGRQEAFKDLDTKGLAFAYAQAEVEDWMQTSVLTDSNKKAASYFHMGYRQAVMGFWMSMR